MSFVEYLKDTGYARFSGAVDERVYLFFHCPHPRKARWYLNPDLGSYQCVGCKERCETDDPEGFQLPLF